jgi:hypothetical protein
MIGDLEPLAKFLFLSATEYFQYLVLFDSCPDDVEVNGFHNLFQAKKILELLFGAN